MSARIIVYADAPGRGFGGGLGDALAAAGYAVRAIECEKFPIADSLPATLLGLANQCDLVVAVISDTPNATGWLARELRHESLYPRFVLAVMPAFAQWQGTLDEGSFRVLAPGCDIVARVDEWIAPLPRPAEQQKLGRWVSFDPAWIIRTVRDQLPARTDLARALQTCTRAIWDSQAYQSFVGAGLTAAEAPFQESLVVKDHVLGMVSIHVAPDGRIAALGYLARVR